MAVTTYREASRELLRETVFAAAREQLADQPWSRVSMAELAATAGVSRQTVYNEFGSREAFAQALVRHEAERFFEGVEAALRNNLDDPARAIEATLNRFLSEAADDPLVRALLAEEGDGGLLPFVTTRGLPLVSWASARIAAVAVEGWPEIDATDANLLAETLVRLAISQVTTPSGTPEEAATAAARLLAPFALKAIGRSSS